MAEPSNRREQQKAEHVPVGQRTQLPANERGRSNETTGMGRARVTGHRIRFARVGDELGLGGRIPGLLNLDDALERHAFVSDADEDRVLGGGGGGALTRGDWGRRGAARGLVGASAEERQAAAQEARVGEERVGVGGGRPRRLRRQPPRGEGGGEGAGREGGTAPAASTAAVARRGRWGGGLGGREGFAPGFRRPRRGRSTS
jgi:hypothetical protein